MFWPHDAKSQLIGKDPDAEKEKEKKSEGRRRRWQQRMICTDDIIDSMEVSLKKLWEFVKDRKACHAVIHEVAKSQTQLSDWRTTMLYKISTKIA